MRPASNPVMMRVAWSIGVISLASVGVPGACVLAEAPDTPWGEGETLECPVDVRDDAFFAPPQVDPELGLVDTEDGRCPSGAEPHPGLICADGIGPCGCRLQCEPGCAEEELCMDDGDGVHRCQCHPSYVDGVFGCRWPGLTANPSFDGCQGWSLLAAAANDARATAEIVGGRLHLAVERLCSVAAAFAVGRAPARAELSSGAALVFDYTASEMDVGADPANRGMGIVLWGGSYRVQPSDEPREHRECVRLEEYPHLIDLSVFLEAGGVCDEEVDWHFWVDNIRLEADASCD
jgi:hypothetical protein